MRELVFDIVMAPDGGYCAEALEEGIFTQGDTWEELRANVEEATRAYFFDGEMPATLRPHLRRNEVSKVA